MTELERRLTAAWERLAKATGVLLPSGARRQDDSGRRPQPAADGRIARKPSDDLRCGRMDSSAQLDI